MIQWTFIYLHILLYYLKVKRAIYRVRVWECESEWKNKNVTLKTHHTQTTKVFHKKILINISWKCNMQCFSLISFSFLSHGVSDFVFAQHRWNKTKKEKKSSKTRSKGTKIYNYTFTCHSIFMSFLLVC